jgi:2-keto-3-deoxy-L-rhamnonate aldolase RhmA
MALDFGGGENLNSIAIKEAFRKGEIIVGTWIFEFNTPGIARLLASTGIDFVVYDMEHSGFGIDSIRQLIAQSRPLNLAALVRPAANEYHLIAPLLDAGASGVIVPKIETASEAARLVATCKYYPEGQRGAAFAIAHDDFLPGNVPAKMKAANDSILCGILIETVKGVQNLEDILEVRGIDLVWAGFLDLSLSMGIPGQFSDPQFTNAINHILQVSKAHGIPAGILSSDPEQAQKHVEEGYKCISYGGDLWLLQRALSEGVQAIRRKVSQAAQDGN